MLAGKPFKNQDVLKKCENEWYILVVDKGRSDDILRVKLEKPDNIQFADQTNGNGKAQVYQ